MARFAAHGGREDVHLHPEHGGLHAADIGGAGVADLRSTFPCRAAPGPSTAERLKENPRTAVSVPKKGKINKQPCTLLAHGV